MTKKKVMILIAVKLLLLTLFSLGGWWYYSEYIQKSALPLDAAPQQNAAYYVRLPV